MKHRLLFFIFLALETFKDFSTVIYFPLMYGSHFFIVNACYYTELLRKNIYKKINKGHRSNVTYILEAISHKYGYEYGMRYKNFIKTRIWAWENIIYKIIKS